MGINPAGLDGLGLASEVAEQRFHCAIPHLAQRYAHAAQRWLLDGALRPVVQTNNGHVLGNPVSGFAEGLHGAQAELVRVPLASSTLVKVPPGLDLDVALLAGDILSTALFGAHLASVEKGDSVVVVGCGPVGVLAVLASLHRGAERVFALDRVTERLELAERWGAIPVDVSADDVVEALRNGTGGRGADAAIEAVGSSDATRLAADVLRLGGRLSAVGVHTEPHLALSPGEIYDRNLTYSAGRCPARAFMPQALELAQRHQDRLKSLISHRFPLARGVEAYRVFAERRDGCTKAVLIP